MNRNVLIRVFAALRFTTGIAAWLAPNTTGRLIGLSAGRDQPLTTQLFGSRELTLAVAITDTASPRLQTRALQLGLLTDLLDVIAAALDPSEPSRLPAQSSPEAAPHSSQA